MNSDLPHTIFGRLAYFDEAGNEWGRERFSVTKHAHGRTYRSLMEMDNHELFRDTNWSMSLDWRPLEGFSRETVGGETVAHSWYRIDGKEAEFETFTKEEGRSSQRVKADRDIGHLGIHAILSDTMVWAARGCTEPGVEKSIVCLANSLDGYGRGVTKALIVEPLVTYLGHESLDVVAGTFKAEHFMVRWSDTVPKYSHLWISPEYYVPLRLEGASDPVVYELAELILD
jgi:hypothetical protein